MDVLLTKDIVCVIAAALFVNSAPGQNKVGESCFVSIVGNVVLRTVGKRSLMLVVPKEYATHFYCWIRIILWRY